ncbi:uncharacterized protein LOC120720561 [Scomber scombrus]|uniref:Uncharacterized protein LOC120720561 n=1 Tax=Scomber scombrus TaxID=13677 RepID=A0AAV1P2F7_SCOSC
MAPGCSAGRLSLCSVFTVCVVFYLFCQEVSSLLTYDRGTLLEIGGFFDHLKCDKLVSCPPCLEEIPEFLRRPPLYFARQRRRRRRGKRGGLRVRLEANLRYVRVSDRCNDLHFLEVPLSLRSRRTRGRWIRPVLPDVSGFDSVSCSVDPDQLLLPPSSWRARTGRRGVDR